MRPGLARARSHARKLRHRDGDTLVVWKLDRLLRSLKDVPHIMERMNLIAFSLVGVAAGAAAFAAPAVKQQNAPIFVPDIPPWIPRLEANLRCT